MYIIYYLGHDDGEGGIVFPTYDKLLNVKYAPEANVTGDAMPANEFELDIVTTDDIEIGYPVALYDDMHRLWAQYWLSYAEHVSKEIVHIRARTIIALLDNVKMDAVMYSGTTAGDAIGACFTACSSEFNPGYISIDSTLASVTLSGYCPEQTARERLTWILFTVGGYCKSAFTGYVEFLPLDSTTTLIPIDRTYYKPTVNYADWVTSIKAKTYSFAAGTPGTTDEYVTAGGVDYIVTEGEVSLSNPDAPSAAPENVVEIDGVYLVNSNNVSAILSRLSTRYFNRVTVEAQVINNAEYAPGDKVTVYTEQDQMYTGYIESAEFAFGVQSASKIKLAACDDVPCAALTIKCVWDNKNVGLYVYNFPVSYAYSVTVPYIDMTMNGHRYIFRPTTETVTGTMSSSGATVEVECAVALDLYEDVLTIINVDGITTVTEDNETVGVIE